MNASLPDFISPANRVEAVNSLGLAALASPTADPLLSAAPVGVNVHSRHVTQTPPAMLPPSPVETMAVALPATEENSGTAPGAPIVASPGLHETPAASAPDLSAHHALDDKSLTEARRREQILDAFAALVQDGCSRQAAALQVGTPYVTLWRWEKRYQAQGFVGLIPHTEDCGRKSGYAVLLGDTAFCAKLTELYLATVGASGGNVVRGRRTAKMATALTSLAEEPECPVELARRLRRGKFPIDLLRFLKRITPEVENRFRGAKHFQLNGLVSRRDLTLRFPDGSRAEMPAGFKWVFDDMSVNQPFWCEVAGQILFSRQGLYAIDQRSLRWLGKMLVARPREAYRAEDILRFLRGLFLSYGGKPDVIVFEQGIWRARKIHGYKLDAVGVPEPDDIIRPEMPEEEKHLLTNGLAAIGIKVIFATSAHGKIIEACFNPLQDQIALRTREFVNIGRHAGEFEIPAKRLAQVRAESRTPSFLGFAPMYELAARIDAALQAMNARTNSRGEIADEIWSADLARRPLAANQPLDAHVFLPEVRERAIVGGCVTVRVNNQAHDFRADWMAELGTGYRVYCRFDPAEPARGAAIYNRETGANNFQGHAAGKFLGFAAWEMPAPSVDVTGPVRGVTPQPVADFYGDGAVDQGDTIRRKQSKLVATAFSALPRPGQPAVRMNEQRDGEGRVARVESARREEATPATATATAPVLDAPRVVAPARGLLSPPSADEFARRRAQLARAADQARELQTLATP